jgi:hypothetical protein
MLIKTRERKRMILDLWGTGLCLERGKARKGREIRWGPVKGIKHRKTGNPQEARMSRAGHHSV